MGRDFLVYAVLLVAGLGTAYYVSLPQEASSDEVSWIKIEPKQVESLTYQGDGKTVEIKKQENADGYWVTYSEHRGEDQDAEVTQFKGNEKAVEVLDWFNPLYAKRDVGAVSDVDLKEFELDKEDGMMVLAGGGKSLIELQVGKRAYGSRSYFVLDKEKKRVLLVSGSQIENITKAKSRMVERSLTGLEIDQIKSATLKAGENATKEIDHSKKNGAGQLIWTDSDKEEEKASYKNLMTKISKLRVKGYGAVEDQQSLATLIPFAELTLKKDANKEEVFRFVKKQNAEAAEFWVWSSFLGAYAQVDNRQAESLEKDIPAVVLD